MRQRRRMAQGLTLLAAVALIATACGSSSSSGGSSSGGTGKPIVVGTTDKVVSFDPAGSYDQGSWTPMYSMYQTLLFFAPGSTKATRDWRWPTRLPSACAVFLASRAQR